MKQTLLAILLMITYTLFAQEQKGPPSIAERLKRTMVILQKEVNLSVTQLKTTELIFNSFFIKADKLRKDNPPIPAPSLKVKAAMDKLVMERDQNMKKILTATQFKNYTAAAIKLHPPPSGNRGKNGPPPGN